MRPTLFADDLIAIFVKGGDKVGAHKKFERILPRRCPSKLHQPPAEGGSWTITCDECRVPGSYEEPLGWLYPVMPAWWTQRSDGLVARHFREKEWQFVMRDVWRAMEIVEEE